MYNLHAAYALMFDRR